MTTIAMLGTGNMGSALAHAAAKSGDVRLLLANRTHEKAQRLAQQLGAEATSSCEAARQADFIFLGVKPQMMAGLLAEIAPVLAQRTDRFVLVSMAAGLHIADLQAMAGDHPIIRIMPNTPVAIGCGLTLYCKSEAVTDEEMQTLLRVMQPSGRFAPIDEHIMDAGSAVAGCGPAFVDLFIEALSDGGVACGLPRKAAIEYAAQMVYGAAALILQSGKHPAELKDAVCSPAGTTIQGVRTLEQNGFRAAVMNAVIAACEQDRKLSK